jgi:NitT/TauT family transport system permease protein
MPMQIRRSFFLLISILLALLGWFLITRLGNIPAFMLPPPGMVWQRFVGALQDGSLLRNGLSTLEKIVLGLVSGVGAATLLGYLLAKSPLLERLLTPYIVASQSIPVVAIAPLLIIWFGSGMLSKVLICALIVFFPVLINTIVGLRAVPENLRQLMRVLRASRWQTFRLLEVPAALPVFLGGLRIGATLSVIGAVVGEFMAPDRGLGRIINEARGRYDTALVFVAVFTLVAMALALYGLVALAEKHLLWWQYREIESGKLED